MTAERGVTQWVSFTDEDDTTWLFDLTFLTSDWRCTFGTTCPGIEADDDGARGCCVHGAHMIDGDERDQVAARATMLRPELWQNHDLVATDDDLFIEADGELITATVDDACIFFNAPDFAGGHGCAFHLAALAADERPIDWKPAVCWHVPFRLEEHDNASGTTVVTIKAWHRSDWGAGGADFSWWCTDELRPAARVADSVLEHHLDELIELVGDWPVDQLRAWVQTREVGVEIGSVQPG